MAVERLRISNYRSFPLSPGKPVDIGPFSPGVNLIVGPNGAGKSSLMNAIKVLFARATETSQRILSREHAGWTDFCAEHRDPKQPWFVEADLAFSDGALAPGVVRVERRLGEQRRRRILRGRALPPDPDKRAEWRRVYDRHFPLGWPREVTHLDSPAFKNRRFRRNNLDYYRKEWSRIRGDAAAYLGATLCPVHALASPFICPQSGCAYSEPLHERECSRCGLAPAQPGAGRRHPGLNFRDRHGARLLHGSDGQGHFLFIIMEVRKHRWPTAFLLEEPDVYMHPAMQKDLVAYLQALTRPPTNHQFFVSTHSPYLINEAVVAAARGPGVRPKIFRLRYREPNGTEVEEAQLTDTPAVLLDLGHRPSDVLFPNGIVWVEGPSDRTYIKFWLDEWARQRRRPRIRWGRDCEILCYGGSNLPHLDAAAHELAADEASLDKLCFTRRDVAIVMDRDNGLVGKRAAAKREAIRRCEADPGRRLALVVGRNAKEIEDYVPDRLLVPHGVHRRTATGRWTGRKATAARRYVAANARRPLKAIVRARETDVIEFLEQLHARIVGWR